MTGSTPTDHDDNPSTSSSGNTLSIEKAFEGEEVPRWQDQLTVRAFVVSFVLGTLFSVIVMKLNFTTGIIPSINVSAGLLGFFFIKVWTKLLGKVGLLKQPFTRQENTVVQTCVVAIAGLAFSGGFGSYLFGMSAIIAKQKTDFSDVLNIKVPHLGWMIGFMFLVSFVGLFSLIPLRKIMIVDFKLTYPSGTATALLINSFHTPQGAKIAHQQVKKLGKYFSISFLWGFFQWFFKADEGCGFENFPTFGLKAYENRFYFDFSALYIGVGMITPYIVNISILLGAVMSWGVMWPLIGLKKGSWFPADLPESSMQSLQGYKVFISIAMILGDGIYNFGKIIYKTVESIILNRRAQQTKPTSDLPVTKGDDKSLAEQSGVSYDESRRTEAFLKDAIPMWFAVAGYVALAAVSIGVLPLIFPLKWYHILVAYIVAPVLAFCNAYGCGLTDWSLASTYGKLAIFIFGSWVGAAHGGVVAGLAACGVMMSIVSTASDLMQDLKTGYLTLASPRSMFVSQVVGTAMGCIIAPCVFWLFYKAFPGMGTPNSDYPIPFALIYRNMAILGVEGFSTLPKNCLTLCLVFFIGAALVNLVRDIAGWKKWKYARYIPIPMAMAIPFYLGSYFAIDMCIGSLILFVWQKTNKTSADNFAPAVASGLICGDGLWSLPAALLSLGNVKPPICMKFLSRGQNTKVDAFLNGS